MYSLPLLFVLLALVATTSASASADSPIDDLNHLLQAALPTINSKLKAVLPSSYGNCRGSGSSGDTTPGPTPCVATPGNADLYYVHKSWAYKAFARWISGLNTGSFTDISLDAAATKGGGITATAVGVFASLPTSLYIGECFTFDQCSILYVWHGMNPQDGGCVDPGAHGCARDACSTYPSRAYTTH